MTKTRRPAGSRTHPVKSTLGSAFDDGRSDAECLRDEIAEWRDNLDGNNMSHLPKYDEVSECADTLDNAQGDLDGLEVPECIQDVGVSYTQDTRTSAQSRSGRMSNALQALGAAKDGAERWLDENEVLEANVEDGQPTDPDLVLKDPQDGTDAFLWDEETGERTEVITKEDADQRGADRDAVEQFINDLDDPISELEGVDFPGMY